MNVSNFSTIGFCMLLHWKLHERILLGILNKHFELSIIILSVSCCTHTMTPISVPSVNPFSSHGISFLFGLQVASFQLISHRPT